MANPLREDDPEVRLALLNNPKLDLELYTGKLIARELFWVYYQPFLLSRGYKLRARYQPNWIPSWRGQTQPNLRLFKFEDALPLKVVIKCVQTSSEEIPIARYLSSAPLRSDSRNHTVPILDILLLPDDDTQALIFMPILLNFYLLPFRRVGELVNATNQYLQSLELMHEHNIAHRDACFFNLMMDPSQLIPKGFHFSKWRSHDGVKNGLIWRERGSVKSLQYYIIDFGLSCQYPVDLKNVTDTGLYGQDRSVPEQSLTVPYDPFKGYQGFEPLLALGNAMTAVNPNDRPSASEALKLLQNLNRSTLKRRVWRPGLSSYDRFIIRFFGAKEHSIP